VRVEGARRVQRRRGVGPHQRPLARGASDTLGTRRTRGTATAGLRHGYAAGVAAVGLGRIQQDAKGCDGMQLGGFLVQFTCGRSKKTRSRLAPTNATETSRV
ncbi:hypothetical protein AVEN_189747-1, partial [Araneus ventricosus]